MECIRFIENKCFLFQKQKDNFDEEYDYVLKLDSYDDLKFSIRYYENCIKLIRNE